MSAACTDADVRNDLAASYRHCRQVTRASGSSFASAFWMLDAPQRRALHALYAFCRLADDIADDPAVRGDRQALLARLRDELAGVFAGRPETPVGVALADAAARFALREQWLQDLLLGIESDLGHAPMRETSDVELYCHRVASTVGLCVVSVLGCHGEADQRFAVDLGVAVQLTNILRDVSTDARSGRVYLASEDLSRFGVVEDELRADRPSDALRVLLAVYAERARIRYARAGEALLPASERALRPALAMGAIYRALLDRLQRSGFAHRDGVLRLSRPRRVAIAGRVWLLGGAGW